MLRSSFAVLGKMRFASRAFATLPDEVVVFPDDDTVVCWHPEKHFPYECSKPLPVAKTLPYSPLKIGEKDIRLIFETKDRRANNPQQAEELAKLTYTCKHRWFPRARDKKAKKTKPDRPYL